jgi:microcompartment protein CcmL/EutN
VRLVTNQKIKGKRTISIDGAVEEVSKYITKSESWLKVSDAQLVEVASVPRWFRAVELLGDCREKRTEQQKALDKAQRAAREREACWRAEVERTRESLPVAERLEALEAGAELTTRVEWVENDEGKLEQREAVAIDDFKLAATVRAEIAVIGELEPRTLAALKARTAYLDTKNLSDGGDGQAGREIMSLRRRSKPLRVLARGAPRDRWLEGLDGHVNQVQAWRRADLRTRYLYAKFSTLDGGLFYGLRAVSASQFSSHRLVAV